MNEKEDEAPYSMAAPTRRNTGKTHPHEPTTQSQWLPRTKERKLVVSIGWGTCFEFCRSSLRENNPARHLPNARESRHNMMGSESSHSLVGPTDPPQGI
jgi:hypothetical protein